MVGQHHHEDNHDLRDVEPKNGVGNEAVADLDPAERQAYDDVVARDREQYMAWLEKPGV